MISSTAAPDDVSGSPEIALVRRVRAPSWCPRSCSIEAQAGDQVQVSISGHPPRSGRCTRAGQRGSPRTARLLPVLVPAPSRSLPAPGGVSWLAAGQVPPRSSEPHSRALAGRPLRPPRAKNLHRRGIAVPRGMLHVVSPDDSRRSAFEERIGGPTVRGDSRSGRRGLVHRSAYQRVPEMESARHLRRAHQVACDQLVERREGMLSLHPGRRQREIQLKRITYDRRGLGEATRRR